MLPKWNGFTRADTKNWIEVSANLETGKCLFEGLFNGLTNYFLSQCIFSLFSFVIPLIRRLKAKIGLSLICSAYRPLWGGLLSKSVIYCEQVGDYYALYSCDGVGFSVETN